MGDLSQGMDPGVGPPDPWIRAVCLAVSAIAASNRSCTVLPPGCDCHPANPAPS